MRQTTGLLALFLGTGLAAQPLCDSTFTVDLTWTEQSPGILLFEATASLPSNGFIWDFGDGTPGFGAFTQHAFQPGNYTVCLSGWYWNGTDTCWATTCETIQVGSTNPCDDLDASFSFDLVGANIVVFQPATFSGQWSYLWDFGDGTFAMEPVYTHQYPGPTMFQACLTVWAWDPILQDTCFATSCQLVDLTDTSNPCDSTFAVDFNWSGSSSNVVAFQATSTLPANGFIWDFGDGMQGAGIVANHLYDQPGNYNVCLSGWYWNGTDTCWATTCQPVQVGSTNPCDDLDASFSFDPVGGNTVVFQAGTIDNQWAYLWEFGDGTSDFGPVITHTYPGPTLFQACLTVWAWDPVLQDTCFATSCQLVDLIGQSDPCDSLQACFIPSGAGTQAFFFNNCSSSPDLFNTQFLWDFGDGSSSTQIAPTHTFPPGIWTVCLTATWQSCITTDCQVVTVSGGGTPCDSTFAVDFNWSGSGSNVVAFQATSTLPANGFIWDFGDGMQGAGIVANHLYDLPGNYNVCLSGWYWNGTDTCWATTCQPVQVGSSNPCNDLDASFSFDPVGTNIVVFQPATFNGQWSYLWAFGDGSFAMEPAYTHQYPGPALFQACLTVWAWDPILQDTCFATSCQLVDLTGMSNPCDSTFAVDFDWSAQSPGIILFEASSTLPTNGFIWDFGDGTPGFGATTQHAFQPGDHTVCLSGWYWNGTDTCWATTCQTLDVLTLGLEDRKGSSLRVHPVPARDVVWVDGDGPDGQGTVLRLFTADGRMVREERPVSWPHAMSLNGMASGVHVLRWESPGTRGHARILIVE